VSVVVFRDLRGWLKFETNLICVRYIEVCEWKFGISISSSVWNPFVHTDGRTDRRTDTTWLYRLGYWCWSRIYILLYSVEDASFFLLHTFQRTQYTLLLIF